MESLQDFIDDCGGLLGLTIGALALSLLSMPIFGTTPFLLLMAPFALLGLSTFFTSYTLELV